MQLQEADTHQYQRVGRNAPGEHLVQIPLQQELFQHQHQLGEHRVFSLEVLDQLGRLHPGLHVEGDVHLDLGFPVGQLDDRDGRLVEDAHRHRFGNATVDQFVLERSQRELLPESDYDQICGGNTGNGFSILRYYY